MFASRGKGDQLKTSIERNYSFLASDNYVSPDVKSSTIHGNFEITLFPWKSVNWLLSYSHIYDLLNY